MILTNTCFTKRAYFPEGLLSREGLLFSIYGNLFTRQKKTIENIYQNFFRSSWQRLGKKREVRLSYYLTILATFLSLFGLILVELPRLYSSWTGSKFIFRIRLCQYLWISMPIIDVFHLAFLAIIVIGIWFSNSSQYTTNKSKTSFSYQ